ncbi:MAG: emp24/gp25L/p24 family protein, partial [Methanosarcinales archaeon]
GVGNAGATVHHVDHRAAFQPSHILDFRLEPGQTQQFFEEIDQETVGRVIRGDWFVTEGDVFSLKVEILSPSGVAVYAEGPLEEIETNGVTEKRPMEQGSFKFVARDVGTYTVNIVNPSSSYSRAVAFAWLVGRDDDDPVVGQLLDGDHEFMGAEPSVRGAFINVLAQSSRVHKRLDEVSAMLEYADVRYKRHMATVQSTLARLNWYTAIEMLLTIAAAVTQVLFVRNLKYHSGLPSLV